jgi:hypothetical protein
VLLKDAQKWKGNLPYPLWASQRAFLKLPNEAWGFFGTD